jgi:hypothetical protein
MCRSARYVLLVAAFLFLIVLAQPGQAGKFDDAIVSAMDEWDIRGAAVAFYDAVSRFVWQWYW